MNNQRATGIALLVAGFLLLAYQLDWFDLSGPSFLAVISLLIGLSLIRKAITNPDRRGALGGTFFLLFAIFLFLVDTSTLMRPIPRPLFIGGIFSCLAIANLVYFLVTRWQRNLNLFMFFFFGAIGGSILMVYYQIIDVWQFEEIASNYWPVLLIILGAIILIDSLVQKQKRLKKDEEKSSTTVDEQTLD